MALSSSTDCHYDIAIMTCHEAQLDECGRVERTCCARRLSSVFATSCALAALRFSRACRCPSVRRSCCAAARSCLAFRCCAASLRSPSHCLLKSAQMSRRICSQEKRDAESKELDVRLHKACTALESLQWRLTHTSIHHAFLSGIIISPQIAIVKDSENEEG